MGKLRKCKRCKQRVRSNKFHTRRNTDRYGEMVDGKKLLKTCYECRGRKNATSRANYAENNEGVRSRGPQKDLVYLSYLLRLKELEHNLRLASSNEFSGDFDKTEFTQGFDMTELTQGFD